MPALEEYKNGRAGDRRTRILAVGSTIGGSVSGRGRHNSRLRQAAFAALDLALLGGAVARWSYRWGGHGTLRVTTHQVQLAHRAPLPRPLVIAFASDFHAGTTTHPALFSAVVDEIARRQPDVLFLGGDFVSSKAEHVHVLCESLSRCNPPLGKYAVLGNHDLWAEDTTITRQLNSCGVQVLVNSNRALPAPFDCISVCGIDDPWTGRVDMRETFRNAGAVRIFLSHSPDGLLLIGDQRFDLGFAGHTHGGQIALRNGTAIISAGGPLARTYGRGRFEIEGNGPMIVSRGVGCSNVPLRINSDPEVIICELRTAD
jgi:uncharacterized protein